MNLISFEVYKCYSKSDSAYNILKYLERYRKLSCGVTFNLEKSEVHPVFVVIPAYKEKLGVLVRTLNSLKKSAIFFNRDVSVLILINWNVKDSDKVKLDSESLYRELSKLSISEFDLKVFKQELSGKKSGVGMARKILMDTAFTNMLRYEIDGIIINLDADTTVSENYFTEITSHFYQNLKMEAASIAFSHIDDSYNEDSIVAYELHLRIFVNMQRLLNLPFAYQTVGSAMVVRRNAYAKEGGMVKRQAGEDFYFLHKYTKNLTLFEINSACVFPSSRGSDRVPFGTGKAVNDINDKGAFAYTTYNPKSFEALDEWLKEVFNNANELLTVKNVYVQPKNDLLKQYLDFVDGFKNIKEIVINVTDFKSFHKRFFNWFDAFALMKYLHFVRDLGHEDVSIELASDYLFQKLKLPFAKKRKENLEVLREFDFRNVF